MLRQSGIIVPPLREMTEDIPDIADYLLSIYAQQTSQPKKRLDALAIKALKLYPWPGNIRELKDTVLMAAFHTDDDTISADDLVFSDILPETAEDLTHRNPKAERDRIIRAYIRAGTWRGAAKLLDVSEKTLIQLRNVKSTISILTEKSRIDNLEKNAYLCNAKLQRIAIGEAIVSMIFII